MTQTMGQDLEAVIAHARAAQERRNAPPITDAAERYQRLRPVLERLPAGMRAPSRSELEARINPRILRAVTGWRWGDGNLVLLGATGSGKTSGAAHLVRRLCFEAAARGGDEFERAQLIRWQSCRALSEVARETRLGTGIPEDVLRCQNARLLVLNDLGQHDDTVTLERILDERYERGWPTVTTTGLAPTQLDSVFGDALARRIFECGADRGGFVEVKRGAA